MVPIVVERPIQAVEWQTFPRLLLQRVNECDVMIVCSRWLCVSDDGDLDLDAELERAMAVLLSRLFPMFLQ